MRISATLLNDFRTFRETLENMTLQEKISADLKAAMKESNTEVKNILRVVIGEFNRIGKELTDDIAVKEIKKMYVNANDLGNTVEVEILGKYLPKELSEDELKTIIGKICNYNGYGSMKDMGAIMSKLKETHPNQYDGKLASTIIKNRFK